MRLLSSYLFTIDGSMMSWKSSLQHMVALSIIETVYIVTWMQLKKLFGLEDFLKN